MNKFLFNDETFSYVKNCYVDVTLLLKAIMSITVFRGVFVSTFNEAALVESVIVDLTRCLQYTLKKLFPWISRAVRISNKKNLAIGQTQ